MKENDLCFICFHQIKKSHVVNKNLLKIFELLSGIKFEEQLAGIICLLCHTRLEQAQQLCLMGARTDHHHRSESDEIEGKIKSMLLEQSNLLSYSVPKYEKEIKSEIEKDFEDHPPETRRTEKICVNELSSTNTENESKAVVREFEEVYITDTPENTQDSSPELLIKKDPNLTSNLPSEPTGDPLKECNIQGRYVCQFCGMKFKWKTRLRDHLRVHTGEKPFTCDDCGMSFRTKGTLTHHIRDIHLNHKPYVCTICNKRFTASSHLRVHTRFHSGERPFACECGSRFATASARNMHFRTGAHARTQRKKLSNECQKALRSKAVHEKGHMCNWANCGAFRTERGRASRLEPPPSEPKSYRCHCGQEFRSKILFVSHIKVHLMFKLGDFSCPVCGETYTCADMLGTHLLHHPYTRHCFSCQRTCSNEVEFKVHVRKYHPNLYVIPL